VLTAPIIENKDAIGAAIEDTFSAAEPILKTFEEVIGNVFETVKTIYNESVKPVFDALKKGLTEIGAKALELYEQYMLPVITYASEKLREIANGPIKDLLEKIRGFVKTVSDALILLWNNVLKPLVMAIMEYVVPKVAQSIKNIISYIKVVADYLGAMLGFAIDNLKNFLNFFITGFTEGWGKAWEDLKVSTIATFEELWNKMKGVINSILGGVESMANGVVNAINKMIDAMNQLSFEIPDWVPGDLGGKTFGVNIPKISPVSIPRLATGTVVPANYGEFAAILGDNKREAEVVSPVSTMKRAFKEAIAEMGGLGGGEYTFIAQLDGDVIFRETVRQNKMYKKQTGKSALA